LLPATLGAFRKLCPQVALNLFDMTSTDQYPALVAQKIDLGFVGPRSAHSGHELLFECVPHDRNVAVLSYPHPLAKKPKLKATGLGDAALFIGMSEDSSRRGSMATQAGAGRRFQLEDSPGSGERTVLHYHTPLCSHALDAGVAGEYGIAGRKDRAEALMKMYLARVAPIFIAGPATPTEKRTLQLPSMEVIYWGRLSHRPARSPETR
jgi:DNA-binding transcriptional LysR family regulator